MVTIYNDALKTTFRMPLKSLSQLRKFLSYKIKPQRDRKKMFFALTVDI